MDPYRLSAPVSQEGGTGTVTRWGRGVGRAADRCERARVRLPKVEGDGHPPWVGDAISSAVPVAVLLLVEWALQRLHSVWLSGTAAGGLVAYVVLCYLFPWLVAIGRGFARGYRSG